MINIYSGVKLEPEYISMLVVDGKNSIVAVKQDGTTDVYSNKIENLTEKENKMIEKLKKRYRKEVAFWWNELVREVKHSSILTK